MVVEPQLSVDFFAAEVHIINRLKTEMVPDYLKAVYNDSQVINNDGYPCPKAWPCAIVYYNGTVSGSGIDETGTATPLAKYQVYMIEIGTKVGHNDIGGYAARRDLGRVCSRLIGVPQRSGVDAVDAALQGWPPTMQHDQLFLVNGPEPSGKTPDDFIFMQFEFRCMMPIGSSADGYR